MEEMVSPSNHSSTDLTQLHQEPGQATVSDQPGSNVTFVGSTHTVSEYEASSYYRGISYDHPLLLFRTGNDKYPFVKPGGSQPYSVSKSARPVYGTPLNAVWCTVGPRIRDLINAQRIRYTSIDVVRFITHNSDEEDVPGPAIVWIGVYPQSTTPDTAHDLSNDILGVLQEYGIEGVEVEWRESVFRLAAGPPPLLSTVTIANPTVDVRGPLTTRLGVPIATAERPDTQGTLGFFFHEGRDRHGEISTRVLGVTCRHVLLKTTKTDNAIYERKGAGAPPKHVRLLGTRRFQKLVDDIKQQIIVFKQLGESRLISVQNWEAKEKSQHPDVAAEHELYLDNRRRELAHASKGLTDLKKLARDVERDWGRSEDRNIAIIDYSPSLAIDDGPEQFTEDWGTLELDESRWKAHFSGNVLDLGTEISEKKFITLIYPRDDGKTAFKYPDNRQLRMNGIVPKDILVNPDLRDFNNEPCLFVLKDGNATGVTVGRVLGMKSFVRNDETQEESMEVAIVNCGPDLPAFSEPGDSGALVVDGLGRMVGLLHAGSSKSITTGVDVTYATPMHWLWPRIKKKYPHANLYRTSWST